jgi:tetratricopeptide (TPR) repeat protein
MLEDYQRALQDLDKVNVLEPNNAFTLQCCGDVEKILKDYQRALKDIDMLMFLNPIM